MPVLTALRPPHSGSVSATASAPAVGPMPVAAKAAAWVPGCRGSWRLSVWHGGERSPRQRELDAVRSSADLFGVKGSDAGGSSDGRGAAPRWGAAPSVASSEGASDPELIQPTHGVSRASRGDGVQPWLTRLSRRDETMEQKKDESDRAAKPTTVSRSSFNMQMSREGVFHLVPEPDTVASPPCSIKGKAVVHVQN